ncbi:hypothetical protein H6P81_020536 [Aristolochia fimbriata]|uniref:Uncharacterized protein n=1 Tax=Aristolochia fimbriata TaxID=158543 RepID=A0AAV7DXP8_ARIFI|nr:hypothetical protein H6P81_020536 [Aristolochia fimbriata]
MASKLSLLPLFLLIILVPLLSHPCCEARPMSPFMAEMMGIAGELSSMAGRIDTLTGIKNSGPSPGDGHSNGYMFVNGGIKDAGPSPGGGGHKFITVDTVEGIKNSGPSPRGGGH